MLNFFLNPRDSIGYSNQTHGLKKPTGCQNDSMDSDLFTVVQNTAEVSVSSSDS